MHHCVVVLDSGGRTVDADARGTKFDWGSQGRGESGGIVKINPAVHVKPFDSDEYKKGIAHDNEWTYRGTTSWSDRMIRRAMETCGDHYNSASNNCRQVTGSAIHATMFATYDDWFARTIEIEREARQEAREELKSQRMRMQ